MIILILTIHQSDKFEKDTLITEANSFILNSLSSVISLYFYQINQSSVFKTGEKPENGKLQVPTYRNSYLKYSLVFSQPTNNNVAAM